MGKSRLEAFSDGVIAIIITIMVLELKVPHGAELTALWPLIPLFISYVLSFVFVGIYWNNHHHLMHAAQKVNGPILWSNLFLLFCLSLIPFTTAWMGENNFSQWPVILYGLNLILCGVAYYILTKALIYHHGANSLLAKALGRDFKGKASLVIYLLGITLAFVNPWIAMSLYTLVSFMWIVPDRRIEKKL